MVAPTPGALDTQEVKPDPEAVELVARLYATIEADEQGIPDLSLYAEDVEIRDFDLPDAGRYVGHDGFLDWLAQWDEAWEDYGIEPLEFIDAGGGCVVVLQRLWARGPSGLTIDREDGIVYVVRGGRIASFEYHSSRDAALEAAGLGRR